MAADAKRSLESLVAALPPAARGGHSVEAIARTWRFAGIVDLQDVRDWLAVGVFDGHRAGLLRMAGVEPRTLASFEGGKQLAFDFAMGTLSVVEVARAVRARIAEEAAADSSRRRVG